MAKKTNIPVHTVASDGATASPSDSAVVDFQSLYVGSGGNLVVQLANSSNTVKYKYIPDGSFLPIAVRRILATGTTAAAIIGHKASGLFMDKNRKLWQ